MSSCFAERLEPRLHLSAGSPDATFGNAGKAFYTVAAPPAGVNIEGLAEEADGKILVATNLELLRFTREGFIDATFGDHGAITPGMVIAGMAVQADGKVLVSGNLDGSHLLGVKRFDLKKNGAADLSFGKAGVFSSTIMNPSASDADELTVQRDGKILVNASAFTQETSGVLYGLHHLLRLNSNGTLDTKFGRAGDADGSHDLLSTGVAVRKDGTIAVAAGASPAITYNGKGVVTTLKTPVPLASAYDPPLVASGAQALAVRPDGTFVYVGDIDPFEPFVSFQGQASPVRFDPSLPVGGGINLPSAVAAGSDGKVVVAGSTYNGYGVERFGPNQRPDPSFGTGGSVFFAGNDPAPQRLAVARDGHILGAAVSLSGNDQIVVTRYEGGANPDTELPIASLIDAPPPVGALQYFTVKYADNFAVKASTIKAGNVAVKGPGSFGTRSCSLVGVSGGGIDGSPLYATYSLRAPRRTGWAAVDNGEYSVLLRTKQISDTSGRFAAGGTLGTFTVQL